jgi:hypothetical protein
MCTFTLPSRTKKPKTQEGPLRRAGDRGLVAVDAQLEPRLDELRDAGHDPLPRPLASNMDHDVVGVADETVTAPLQPLVEVVEHDVG